MSAIKYRFMADTHSFVLEVGCGLSKGGKYCDSWVGLDLEKIVKPMIIGDARMLPFKDKAFSLVYSFGLIEHFDDPHTLLMEMKRVGNIIYFSIPKKNGLIDLLHRLYQKLGKEWLFPSENYYGPSDFPQYQKIMSVMGCEDLYVC